jgi:hypothetical protein
VTAGEKGDQDLADDLALPDDGARELLLEPLGGGGELGKCVAR